MHLYVIKYYNNESVNTSNAKPCFFLKKKSVEWLYNDILKVQ